MAGFKTHFSVAAVVGGVAGTVLLSAGLIDHQQLLFCFVAAVVGGLLPDIDSDSSTILTVGFTFFSLMGSFFVMYSQATRLSTAELLIAWLTLFLFFKLGVFELFTRLTVHRGIFHSIPAAFFFFFLSVIALGNMTSIDNQILWIIGFFLFFGCILHLLLDELYSLNLLGAGGVRHSFGTAFKFYSSHLPATVLLYVATIALFWWTPASEDVLGRLLSPTLWSTIADRFLPAGEWFGPVR